MRRGPRHVLITPAGARKEDLAPRDVIEVSLAGTRVRGSGNPSTESALHLAAYRAREDVGAVVHAHPPYATAFGTAGVPLHMCASSDREESAQAVPVVPFAPPGTDELAEQFVAFLDGSDVALLSNHGAVAVGATLDEALARMEGLDDSARILLNAHILRPGRLRE